jgi:hypothetical protein
MVDVVPESLRHNGTTQSDAERGNQMYTTRRIPPLAAYLAVSLLGVALLATPGTPAMAATSPTATPATLPMYQIVNERSASCLQEDGTTDAVYDGLCAANSSGYWRLTPYPSGVPELVNVYSGKCVSVTGTEAGIYMNNCAQPNVSAQQWWLNSNPPPAKGVDLSPTQLYIWNVHSQYCLWQGNPSVSTVNQARCASQDERDFWALVQVF